MNEHFNWKLLGNIVRRRARFWTLMVLALWIGLTFFCLLLVPRTFSATASVALQQSPSPGGALGALAGLSGTTTKTYAGVIHSRSFALAAARATHIQALYHLPIEDDAATLVQNNVTMEDKQDGLIYLTANLPAPPKLVLGQSQHVIQIQKTAPAVANEYVALLSNYLDTTNTNRDAALLREAQKQLAQARANYDRAVKNFGRIMQASPSVDATSAVQDGSTKSSQGLGQSGMDVTMAGMSQLSSLYAAKSRLETEIAAGNALHQGTVALASSSPLSLSTLPEEDPLLQESRRQVTLTFSQLQNLRITLSDDNPDVVAANHRFHIAQAQLKAESKAIQQNRTSESIRQQSLKAEYVTVLRQISAAERKNITGRATTIEIEKLRNEMLLRLEVLKATATQSASLSIQSGAGKSMMDIVDVPEKPKSSRPGVLVLTTLSFFLALFLVQCALIATYCRQLPLQTSPPIN